KNSFTLVGVPSLYSIAQKYHSYGTLGYFGLFTQALLLAIEEIRFWLRIFA
uniref:Uncharacterized protein n=1 Tax=Acrobeloides nanus TaxID=290746 RepID=A0A914DFC0_9BILA